jgi:hypothetical protein
MSEATYTPPQTILDTASKRVLSLADDNASQSAVINDINTATNGYALDKIAGLQSYDMTKATDKGLQMYQPLKTELDRMNYYISGISDILHSLHEPVDGIPGSQACTELNNKKECE